MCDSLYYAKYGNPEPPRRVDKTEAEWRAQLTPAQYQVLRQRSIEPPYRNAYCRSYEPGEYACAGCGSVLFDAATKYHAISGWPSFTQPVAKNAIRYAFDDSHHIQRIEACCMWWRASGPRFPRWACAQWPALLPKLGEPGA